MPVHKDTHTHTFPDLSLHTNRIFLSCSTKQQPNPYPHNKCLHTILHHHHQHQYLVTILYKDRCKIKCNSAKLYLNAWQTSTGNSWACFIFPSSRCATQKVLAWFLVDLIFFHVRMRKTYIVLGTINRAEYVFWLVVVFFLVQMSPSPATALYRRSLGTSFGLLICLLFLLKFSLNNVRPYVDRSMH